MSGLDGLLSDFMKGQEPPKPAEEQKAPQNVDQFWDKLLGRTNTKMRATDPPRRGTKMSVETNLKGLLFKAESKGYDVLAGGAKDSNVLNLTVEQVGKKYGNKAVGMYQIQRDTALDMLRREGLESSKFKFDAAGQDKLFELLLKHRGKIEDYKAGKISKEQFAKNLASVWAGLPAGEHGKSMYQGVGGNKAHITWNQFLAAL